MNALISPRARSAESSDEGGIHARLFPVKGVVRELEPAEQSIIISNETISNYMDAMTMPFKVRDTKELDGLRPGDEVTFRLHVTPTDSWVDQIVRVGTSTGDEKTRKLSGLPVETMAASARNPLWYYHFTNELGQPVSLSDFHGQALAITFFYTRCPLPNFCPRLSKNFEEASEKLEAMPGAPTNWHFLSVSFDAEFDTPTMLKAYGESYQYDPKHWSFLTGPPDKIAKLAEESGVRYESDNGLINHNFRTLIVDSDGHLQTVFPVTGDFSDSIVAEIIKAATVTNRTVVAR
ncbi:MAG TPA: SCO family protein [Candidatus Saccharimonadales bacterium]|nr:SCO family protein [Candidatus Saccharimonadales bacterium]